MDMWRIVVPYHWNSGLRITEQTHHEWDAKVCELTNGLMIQGTSKGKWGLKKEKVILVDIACDEETIIKIQQITKEHYSQEAVLIWKIGGPAYVG
ncbi:hypothetical protein C4565_00505 [Candidatus Parcubacteria bacterium]|nr:MAG: hypothetical protein C4565_00505 [Candidatus Parcubacteria bacterium]